MCEEYNGYSNYETWVVNLWIDNDESSQDYWNDRVKEYLENPRISNHSTSRQNMVYDLSQELKENHEENKPNQNNFENTSIGVYADLLNSALSMVNWREIAENIVNGVIENQEMET
jgi:hypothetical protein